MALPAACMATGTFDAAHQILSTTGPRRTRRLRRGDAAASLPTAASCSSIAAGSPRAPRGRTLPMPSAASRPRHGRGPHQSTAGAVPRARAATRHAGSVWQNLDLARYAEATGLTLLPIVVEQTRRSTAATTLVRDWPAPDAGVEKHRIYMVQWFAFAATGRSASVAVLHLRRRGEVTPASAARRAAGARCSSSRSSPSRRWSPPTRPITSSRATGRSTTASSCRRGRPGRRGPSACSRSACRPARQVGARGGGAVGRATRIAPPRSTRRARRARSRAGRWTAWRACGS